MRPLDLNRYPALPRPRHWHHATALRSRSPSGHRTQCGPESMHIGDNNRLRLRPRRAAHSFAMANAQAGRCPLIRTNQQFLCAHHTIKSRPKIMRHALVQHRHNRAHRQYRLRFSIEQSRERLAGVLIQKFLLLRARNTSLDHYKCFTVRHGTNAKPF